MTVCKEDKKKEAYRRMTELQLNINGIQEFMKEDRLNISSGGSLMHLDDEQTAIVQRFEEEYDVLVYHVIQNDTYLGTMLTLLFVSDQPGEWEQDVCKSTKSIDVCDQSRPRNPVRVWFCQSGDTCGRNGTDVIAYCL